MSTLFMRYTDIKREINKFPQKVQFVAVSKTFDINYIYELYKYGHTDFAENYVQEFCHKITLCRDLNINWHFIGSLQGNKIPEIAGKASWVHSLEKANHAILLNKHRPANSEKLNILLQVNITGEKDRHGIDNISELGELAALVEEQENLTLRGFMGISKPQSSPEAIQCQFMQLEALYNQFKEKSNSIDTLSMGMSNDFKIALSSGSNMVRIGSALFGMRNYIKKP